MSAQVNLLHKRTEARRKRRQEEKGEIGGKSQEEPDFRVCSELSQRLSGTQTHRRTHLLLANVQMVHWLLVANKHKWSSFQIRANDARLKFSLLSS